MEMKYVVPDMAPVSYTHLAAPGYRPGAERFKEMKEVKNEEVCNSFGSLLFLSLIHI